MSTELHLYKGPQVRVIIGAARAVVEVNGETRGRISRRDVRVLQALCWVGSLSYSDLGMAARNVGMEDPSGSMSRLMNVLPEDMLKATKRGSSWGDDVWEIDKTRFQSLHFDER